jgi:hypothetical protein
MSPPVLSVDYLGANLATISGPGQCNTLRELIHDDSAGLDILDVVADTF